MAAIDAAGDLMRVTSPHIVDASMRRAAFALAAAASLLGAAAPAEGQWYFEGYLGGNYTHPADVSVDQPSRELAMDFKDVRFTAEPLTTPPYYGWRAGRLFGAARRVGLELEFIHLKAIAQTDRAYEIVDRSGRLDLRASGPMSNEVARYSMTHGLNFILINVVARQPLGAGRHALVFRLGAGPTLPHAETTVSGLSREQYEFAGPAAHAAAGAVFGIGGAFGVLAEYKVTFARPAITIAEGTGQTTTFTHQVALGFSIGPGR
jgi:hypothetical protein